MLHQDKKILVVAVVDHIMEVPHQHLTQAMVVLVLL